MWADESDIADVGTLVRIADASGLDGRALLRASDDAALREREAALTREALDRKVFGAPFYFHRGEPFWGQDRLEMLEELMDGSRAPIGW